MVKSKNVFVSNRFEKFSSLMSNTYVSRLPRLRRHLYFINQYRIIKYKDEEICYQIRLKHINFDLLVVFYTVVIFGSISKASKYLSVSQPAISLSLKKIEKRLGSLLFKTFSPNAKKIELTPFGLIIFNRIQRLFQIVEEIFNFSISINPSLTNRKLLLTNSKSLILLKEIKKPLFSLDYKSIFFKNFSKKQSYFFKSNFKYFKNNSNFIIKNRIIINKELTQIESPNSINLTLDKIPSFKTLNSQICSSIHNRTSIEIQTTNAINIAYEMNISNIIYWGSML